MTAKHITLYSTHLGADKVYHVFLNPKDGGWTVDFTYGARGKTLKPGTKTATPVPYEKALKVFDKLVAEKKNGDSHYTEGQGSAGAYTSTVTPNELFGLIPMQPVPVTREHIEMLVKDPAYSMQEKANGENRTLRVNDGKVSAGNKKGNLADIPLEWVTQFGALGIDFVANGEHVGDTFKAFDLVEYYGVDMRTFSQLERYSRLKELYDRISAAAPAFGLIECHFTEVSKAKLLNDVEVKRLEGVVAKLVTAPYTEGRSKDTLKFKFNDTITCIVLANNQQRSVQLALLDDKGALIPVGNVTIPANKALPAPGDLVDVQYLYYTGRALEQPVYDPDDTSPRSDIYQNECTLLQIKRHKPCSDDEPAPADSLELALV